MPERIDPGAPQQNGRHERMHRTLKADATRPPQSSFRAQQARFNAWRQEYNEERPHEALGMNTPASLYTPSPRPFPERIPGFEYSEAMPKRIVRPNGCFKIHGAELYIGEVLAGDTIGIEQFDEYHCAIYAGFLPVAILDLPTKGLLRGKHAAPYLRKLRPTVAAEADSRPSPPCSIMTGEPAT